ncbi:hypothetical protein KIW84_074742 [Lathyrus oleraceus]|uniref:Uncharacterized protein n=1 Tax=Pisum sativum TaxID=3888 RepID=A0A9D4VT40_PEA|nr:hypothetical protein KIW84_074742 [Pisum sativum]
MVWKPCYPLEVQIPSLRVLRDVKLQEAEWVRTRYKELSLIEEKRLAAICHGQLYQQRMKRAFDRKVQPRVYHVGDLVLKMILPPQNDRRGKWTPNYEGPFVVKKVFSGGALLLTTMDGEDFPSPVNADAGQDGYLPSRLEIGISAAARPEGCCFPAEVSVGGGFPEQSRDCYIPGKPETVVSPPSELVVLSPAKSPSGSGSVEVFPSKGCLFFPVAVLFPSRSTFLFRYSGRLSPYQTGSSFEVASLPILTGIVNYFPSECKLFVCSWYSITRHPDHLKAEAIHIDRPCHSGLLLMFELGLQVKKHMAMRELIHIA